MLSRRTLLELSAIVSGVRRRLELAARQGDAPQEWAEVLDRLNRELADELDKSETAAARAAEIASRKDAHDGKDQ